MDLEMQEVVAEYQLQLFKVIHLKEQAAVEEEQELLEIQDNLVRQTDIKLLVLPEEQDELIQLLTARLQFFMLAVVEVEHQELQVVMLRRLMKVLEAKEVEAEEQTKVQLLVVNQLQFLRILLYQDKLILAEVEVEEQVYQEIILLVKEVVKKVAKV